MAEHPQAEHYLPIRRADLVRILCDDLGPARAGLFRKWADLLSATFHYECKQLHDALKDAYAPFDPEATTVAGNEPTGAERAARLEELFARLEQLMRQANFRPLDRAAIEEAQRHYSDGSMNMRVDFANFQHLALHVRGEGTGTRRRRLWYKPWRKVETEVPLYRRLVVVVKLARRGRLPRGVDTDDVFLKYFKDIPKDDIEILLPGARMVMPGLLRLKLGGSVVSGLAMLTLSIVKPLLTTAILGMQYLYGLIFGVLGYGWRQYSGYQSTRTAANLRLTESLYFQSVANNASVFFSILDEAQEQDAREAILAYYHLWRHAGAAGWTVDELDRAVEDRLGAILPVHVDFEADDALAKLERLGLVSRYGERYAATPIQSALETLDRLWDNRFQYPRISVIA